MKKKTPSNNPPIQQSTPTAPSSQAVKTPETFRAGKNETHTPGPWKVAGSCSVHESPDGLFYHVAHISMADDYAPNPLIADVGCRGRFCSEKGAHSPGPEQLAIARLIAAAPELLAVLRFVQKYADMKAAKFEDLPAQLTNQINSAIAKATGQNLHTDSTGSTDQRWEKLQAYDVRNAQNTEPSTTHHQPSTPPPPPHIFLFVEGGVVQNVLTDSHVRVTLIDYDVEGADPDRVRTMPDADGKQQSEAFVAPFEIENNPEWHARLCAAVKSEVPLTQDSGLKTQDSQSGKAVQS